MINVMREFGTMRKNSILPCYIFLRNFRVMIIIPVTDNLIIKRMIHQIVPERNQSLIFLVSFRQEPHVNIRGFHIHPPRLGRIKAGQCLGDIVHRIRVFKFFAQFNHFMGYRFHTGFIFIEIIQSFFGTRRQSQKNKECQQTVKFFHGSFHFWFDRTKLCKANRVQKMKTLYLFFGLPRHCKAA